MQRVRLVDVAEAAGVSTATASFVLSGRKGRAQPASREVIRRIQEAASALGYVPNRHAQAVRRGYSTSIVLALGSPEDPWSAQVALEVHRRAMPLGLSTLSLVDETWYSFLSGYTPQVAFVTSTDFEPRGLELVEDLATRGTSLVVFSTMAEPESFDVVSSSPVEPTFQAYARLRSRHRQVRFLSTLFPGETRPGPTRMQGFQKAVADDAGANLDDLVFYAGQDTSAASAACLELLDRNPGPLAVICSTGYLASILREVALIQGRKLPDDLEIIAIGDIPHNETNHLGPISHYGVPDVFSRIADIVVRRAERHGPPFARHEFAWTYRQGATTAQ